MKHKERVLTALNHQIPDRVPFMYCDVPEVRSRLKKDLHLKSDDELFEYLKIDFRWVEPTYIGPELELENGNKKDIWGVEWKYTRFNDGAGYWNEVDRPLKDAQTVEDFEKYNWPQLDWFDFSKLNKECDKYSDFAIMTAPGVASPGIFQTPVQPLIGVERSLMEPYLNPELFQKLIDMILNFQIPFIEKMFLSANGKIDFFRLGDDFGTQTGLLMDIGTWKQYFQPALKKMADVAKKYGAHYYQHSCGDIKDLIPSFIEAGVEIIDPLQVGAKGMNPEKLKNEFGHLVTFSGGIDEQQILPNGSPEEVKNEVERMIKIMSPGGGYFLGPTHNFQDDIPTRNILAMYEAGKKSMQNIYISEMKNRLSHADLLELKRWNTPTIYNGWEQITKHNTARDGFNIEPLTDFMPYMGSMVGYAVTVIIEPGNPEHPEHNPKAWEEYREYVASVQEPKIVVVQDLDKPVLYGAFWGEVNSNIHRALGCIGTITDGGIRDIDEMNNAGFKALARGVCVGHAKSCPVRWDCEVEVFGRKVKPGQLIHADKHGFLVIPDEDQEKLLEAAKFMDSNECKTMISIARSAHGKSLEVVLDEFNKAVAEFGAAANEKFGQKGE